MGDSRRDAAIDSRRDAVTLALVIGSRRDADLGAPDEVRELREALPEGPRGRTAFFEDVLRDRVKALQKNDPKGKEQWIIYTTRYGSRASTKQRQSSRQRDPKFYDEDFLQKFFDNWDNGIMMEGTEDELREVKAGSWSPNGAPAKRTRDDNQGNDDSTGVFFGGLLKDCTEDALKAFAETVGTVKFVKMFTDECGNSRGCGKVFYEDPDVRDAAIKERRAPAAAALPCRRHRRRRRCCVVTFSSSKRTSNRDAHPVSVDIRTVIESGMQLGMRIEVNIGMQ
ncbi:unnamed protein product, partial [Prorocentrum cordatum]